MPIERCTRRVKSTPTARDSLVNSSSESCGVEHAVPFHTSRDLQAASSKIASLETSRHLVKLNLRPRCDRPSRPVSLQIRDLAFWSGPRSAAKSLIAGTLCLDEPVAQLVEQRPFKAWVVRSNRTGLTIPQIFVPGCTTGLSSLSPHPFLVSDSCRWSPSHQRSLHRMRSEGVLTRPLREAFAPKSRGIQDW